MRDARLCQILFLGLLLGAGVWLRDFSLRPGQVALTFLSGLLMQAVCAKAFGLRKRGLLSAVITCFSLSILLRADNLAAHPIAAAAAIGSKFVIRVRGKHLFNPANLGMRLPPLPLPGTWTSPPPWGHDLPLSAPFLLLGALVAPPAPRARI